MLRGLLLVTIVSLLVWTALQASLVVYVEAEYAAMRDNYRKLLLLYLGSHEGDVLGAAWNATLALKREYMGKYGQKILIPSRLVQGFYDPNVPASIPLLSLYCWAGGMNRLVIVQRMGGCGEFTTAVATLLSDTTGLYARKVYFEGIDHSLPEVYWRGWWVFDAYYTTPDRPVKAEYYALYLRRERGGLDRYVSRMVIEGAGLDVLREHGFNASTLVVMAVADLTANPLDDVLAAHTSVEVFAVENMYDPLVATGCTDERGNFSVRLNGGKEYVVVAKHFYGGRPVIGIAKVYLPPNSCVAIEVRLHKYG